MTTNEPLPRVLVVDDEVENLDTFRRVFRRELAMNFARSSSEAIATLQQQDFDLAFADYSMPAVDGLELLRRAAVMQPDMARVIVTAHDGVESIRLARAEGLLVSIVPKPWRREQILQIVSTVLSLTRMRASVERLRGTIKKGPP